MMVSQYWYLAAVIIIGARVLDICVDDVALLILLMTNTTTGMMKRTMTTKKTKRTTPNAYDGSSIDDAGCRGFVYDNDGDNDDADEQ